MKDQAWVPLAAACMRDSPTAIQLQAMRLLGNLVADDGTLNHLAVLNACQVRVC